MIWCKSDSMRSLKTKLNWEKIIMVHQVHFIALDLRRTNIFHSHILELVQWRGLDDVSGRQQLE